MKRKQKKAAQIYRFPVLIERDKDGYFAICHDLQGCYSQGTTYEAALDNIRNAIRLHLEDRVAEHEPFEEPRSVALSTVEVALRS